MPKVRGVGWKHLGVVEDNFSFDGEPIEPGVVLNPEFLAAAEDSALGFAVRADGGT